MIRRHDDFFCLGTHSINLALLGCNNGNDINGRHVGVNGS